MKMRGLEHKEFYISKIPYWWYVAASLLPKRATVIVGCQLWFLYGVAKGKQPLRLSRQYYGLMKFDVRTAQRALGTLEKAGLVKVDRRHGRAPLVTITTDKKRVEVLRREYAEQVYH